MSRKFLRTDIRRFLKLGKSRRKLQVWRAARGVHSKIRRKRKGYPVMPTVGYKTSKKEYGKIGGLKPVLVHNLKELDKAGKNLIVIIARIGAKKKLEIIKKAQERGIKIANIGGQK
jgi:large subunit ribosomal protein L32e